MPAPAYGSPIYQVRGINLKSVPLGEYDRLLTILTRERGLVKAVAVGARKHQSGMSARSMAFMVNDLVLAKGKSLDRVKQCDVVQGFRGISQNLLKLTCAQYWGEITLKQALTDQSQEELFLVLVEHLTRLDRCATDRVWAYLVHGVYHLLAIAGFAPLIHVCCITQTAIEGGQAGFSVVGGGLVALDGDLSSQSTSSKISHYLNRQEVRAMQELGKVDLSPEVMALPMEVWRTLEQVLRAYTQYHFDQPIYTASMLDNFPVLP